MAWGQVNNLAKRFAWGSECRSKLCILPSHSCYIYATWKSKEVEREEILKPLYGEGTNFYRMELTPLNIRFIIFRLVIVLLLIDDVNHCMHLFLTCTYSQQFQTFLKKYWENYKFY